MNNQPEIKIQQHFVDMLPTVDLSNIELPVLKDIHTVLKAIQCNYGGLNHPSDSVQFLCFNIRRQSVVAFSEKSCDIGIKVIQDAIKGKLESSFSECDSVSPNAYEAIVDDVDSRGVHALVYITDAMSCGVDLDTIAYILSNLAGEDSPWFFASKLVNDVTVRHPIEVLNKLREVWLEKIIVEVEEKIESFV